VREECAEGIVIKMGNREGDPLESGLKRIVFASRNRGKIKEVRNIFSDTEFKITSLLDLDAILDIEENENTFEGNAKKKAREVFNHYKIPVIADDSGIEVEQLKGNPGVFSARFAGENASDEDNNLKLLNELKKFPEPHHAKYVCCAVFYYGENFTAEYGEIKGRITMNPKGSYGFGYDPLFVPEGYNQTMAEILPDVKDKISHRGQAFIKLKMKMNIFKENL
jgi:XTP/dITP diphosphohydrolase